MAKQELTTVITDKGLRFIEKFNKVRTKIDNNLWELAKVASETVNAKDFLDMFGTQQVYADAIGMSRPNLNKLVNAYERKTYLEESGVAENFKVSQIEEMLPIEKTELIEFIADYEITADTAIRNIRSCVKAYQNTLLEVEEEQDTEVEEEQDIEVDGENVSRETSDAEFDEPLFVSFKGRQWTIVDPNNITQLIALLDELDKVEKENQKNIAE